MKVWVNADDFGFSESCTNAICYCFEKKYLTTTTACANGDFFEYGVNLLKKNKFFFKIGIHINLTEGKPLSENIKTNMKFCNNDGLFNGFKKRYGRLTKKDKNDLYDEIKAQFEKILSFGLAIDHIDSHHHIHNSFRVLPIVLAVAKEYGIERVRILRNVGRMSLIKRVYKSIINKKIKKYSYSDYMGSFDDYSLVKKNSNKVFEMMIHPDFDRNNLFINRLNDDYNNPIGSQLSFDDIEIIH